MVSDAGHGSSRCQKFGNNAVAAKQTYAETANRNEHIACLLHVPCFVRFAQGRKTHQPFATAGLNHPQVQSFNIPSLPSFRAVGGYGEQTGGDGGRRSQVIHCVSTSLDNQGDPYGVTVAFPSLECF